MSTETTAEMAPRADGGALVIVGPTASGKSALAVALAKTMVGAEILSADAMAVYRGMDVGTAKPSEADRAGIRHHLIDVVDPSESYTVARFQADAAAALAEIASRGGRPIIVGGTGLYVRAVVDDFTLPGEFPEVRAELALEPSVESLWARLNELDPNAAAKMQATNRRRVERALEVTIGSGRPFSSFGPGVDRYPPSPHRQIGLRIERDELDRRIDARYDQQLAGGFVAEVEALAASPDGLSRTAAQALGYSEILDHLAGRCSLDEAMEIARRRTKRFARRQQRWFRRDPRIEWFDAIDPKLVDRVEGFVRT